MTTPAYHLHWEAIRLAVVDRSIPAGAGLYAIGLDSPVRGFTGIYIGKSGTVRRRAYHHRRTWFTAPHAGYWIPRDADAYLRDPVAVFNAGDVAQRLPDRNEIQGRIRERSWFCYATPDLTGREHGLGHLEYVLQEALKMHVGIENDEYIGDSGRRDHPATDLVINSTFAEPFLASTLPATITFRASSVDLS
ncbi:MAG: hypothetical protein F4Y26_12575 [Gammaproteobacteria bacterium]|nr:hypothetical protein [Gammaproteobacteria bacterium]